MKTRYFTACLALIVSSSLFAQNLPETNAGRYFETIKSDSQKLRSFLASMPKGGDLHNHESGAAYAENLIRYALKDNLCVDPITFAVTDKRDCEPANRLDNAIRNPRYYDSIIDAWSMRHFIPQFSESGHDHFFATFGKFSAITNNHRGEILAEIAERAASENESYLELMVTADGNESGRLGKQLGWDPDFSRMRNRLLASNFTKVIDDITLSLDQDEAKMRSLLACDSTNPQAGCEIKIRYLYQVLREQPPEMVFAQLLAGFEAARRDKRVVGVNMVQPEDGVISMRDYALHMRMVGYLHEIYPDVRISLHAGELNQALVPPAGLKFHIHDAVEMAGADRIGHGVDIQQEDNAEQLMKRMAEKHTLVEINLSSNAEILNVEGKTHPLPLYLRYGVPVALSTDDEGVSRSNLTREYLRAVTTYQFDYPTIKQFARNSLAYSFLPGKALWQDHAYQRLAAECMNDVPGADTVSPACNAYLDSNEKAKSQWDLERKFTVFESHY
ncbi:adenosine deaminase family protein [Aquicella siphonis]|uniref:adenosine deaminase family protein n=1 Tax=Aquicella siphonis TaxID=254247 RepID=UPI00155A6AB0|nr:adenosine deaminase [Aquicella siphonis]